MPSSNFFRAIIVAICFTPNLALADAPAGLRNKTIRVSFVSATPAIREGKEVPASRSIARTIYVSGLGRAFTRRSDVAIEGRSKVGEGGPGATRGYRFEGSRLIIAVRAGSNGARQVVINFDSSFRTCSVNVKTGSEGGPRSWTGLNGKRYTATRPTTISNTSCSIENGNAFAQ